MINRRFLVGDWDEVLFREYGSVVDDPDINMPVTDAGSAVAPTVEVAGGLVGACCLLNITASLKVSAATGDDASPRAGDCAGRANDVAILTVPDT